MRWSKVSGLNISLNSGLHWKGEQGGEDEATKTAQIVRLGAEDKANAVIVSNANRKHRGAHYSEIGLQVKEFNAILLGEVMLRTGWING